MKKIPPLFFIMAALLLSPESLPAQGSGAFDITRFGAKADDGKDDSAAIQAAFDASVASASGGQVFVPAGTFHVLNARIRFSARKPILLSGAGWGSKLVWIPPGDAPDRDKGMINISGTGDAPSAHCPQVVLRDLSFDFGASLDTSYQENWRGINIYNADNIRVSACSFQGGGGEMVGIANFGTLPATGSNCLIEGNTFYDFPQDGLNPNAANTRVIGNYFHHGSTGIEAGAPHLIIMGNDFHDLLGAAVNVASVADFIVSGNRMRNCSTLNQGVIVGSIQVVGQGSNHPSTDGIISGNTIVNEITHFWQVGINVARGSSTLTPARLNVSGNVIHGAMQGIFLDQIAGSLVSGNLISPRGGSTGLILFKNAENIDNRIFGNYVAGKWTVDAYADQTQGQENLFWGNLDAQGFARAGVAARQPLKAAVSWDPEPLLQKGAVASKRLPVQGAAPGDLCLAAHDRIGSRKILISAHVSAPDEVLVILENLEGESGVDIERGTLTVGVFQVSMLLDK